MWYKVIMVWEWFYRLFDEYSDICGGRSEEGGFY